MAQPKDEITVVAQLTLTSSEGVEVVKSFDTAWHRALALPTPVNIMFDQFVRKD